MTPFVVNSLMTITMLIVIPALLLGTAYLFRRLDSKERLLAIEKGLYNPTVPRDVHRRSRRAAILLIAAGLGIILAFVVEAVAVSNRASLSDAGLGLIPLALGLGLLLDLRLQRRDSDAPERRES